MAMMKMNWSSQWTVLGLAVWALAQCRPAFAFSVAPSHQRQSLGQRPTTAVQAAHEEESSFWGQGRTKEQVQWHVEQCLQHVDGGDEEWPSHVEVVSAEPPLVVIHNFLSADMCQHIIETAENSEDLKRSTTGEANKESDSRTSDTVWLRDEDCQQPLRLIADKVASISGLPTSNMENLQVCRYRPGQEFKLHTDHLDSFNDLDCRGRLATCLMYLSEPDAGGETWFPGLAESNDQASQPKIAPAQGSAVFFWNTIERPGSPGYDPHMFLNADVQLRHAGLPVLRGEKWICNRWIHPVSLDLGVRGVRPPIHTRQPAYAMV